MATEVKICGIRQAETLRAVMEAGADYFGLVLAPSRRRIDLDTAAALVKVAQNGSRRIQSVALVVDAEDDLLTAITTDVRPDFLQLHGKETTERVGEIRRRWGIPIIKAVSVASTADVRMAQSYDRPGELADVVLYDAKAPEGAVQAGGHGRAFDWSLLAPVRGTRFALAGGLTTETVAEAVHRTGASIVDVSSGVETNGEKDAALIRRFIKAAKAANTAPNPV